MSVANVYYYNLYENKEYEEAIKYYELYSKTGILNAQAFYEMANIYIEKEDYSNALEKVCFCLALENCPEDSMLLKENLIKKVGE